MKLFFQIFCFCLAVFIGVGFLAYGIEKGDTHHSNSFYVMIDGGLTKVSYSLEGPFSRSYSRSIEKYIKNADLDSRLELEKQRLDDEKLEYQTLRAEREKQKIEAKIEYAKKLSEKGMSPEEIQLHLFNVFPDFNSFIVDFSHDKRYAYDTVIRDVIHEYVASLDEVPFILGDIRTKR